MSIQKIIDYAMHTPHNTNPAIFKQVIKDNISWNDLKDKPFYEDLAPTTPVEEQTVSGFAVMQDPIYGVMNPFEFIPTAGTVYTVTWDGVEYECECVDAGDLLYVGNENYANMQSGGDIPFAVIFVGDVFVVTESAEETHTISITAIEAVVHKLDTKYLPTLVGESTAGKVYTIDDTEVTALNGAEIFNDYDNNIASGMYSHAEGLGTIASSECSHAEGYYTTVSGGSSHAEGSETTASGGSSHAEGSETTASGGSSHAEGSRTTASEPYSHAEGQETTASNWGSHAEGSCTTASGAYSHAEGIRTTASGWSSHAEGAETQATIDTSATVSFGFPTTAGQAAHAEGYGTVASGAISHAEGNGTKASGNVSHAEGWGTTASYESSHAEGRSTTASGQSSHAEGQETTASSWGSHAEGYQTTASSKYSHAEGSGTTASGTTSHAEGVNTTASGPISHAEGNGTTASGGGSHAEGGATTAFGYSSHAEGTGTTAQTKSQHTQGEYNILDTSVSNATRGTYAHIVGNGTSDTARSNAHTLDWNGVGWFQGGLQVGGTAQDDGAQTVMLNGDTEIILASSTEGSTKKFKITVDDSGTLAATEVVE